MPSRWEELEQWMEGQKLPKGLDVMSEPDWVEKFVRKMMTKALPAAGVADPPSSSSTFETHHFIIVKFRLPKGCSRDELRLLVRSDKIRIEGLPDGGSESIKLPKAVHPRECRALVRDGVLQVKLRKRNYGSSYYETSIRWE